MSSFERYTTSRMTFTNPDCQRMYDAILQTIWVFTGCSDASGFYALNPYIAQIWARATEEQRDDNVDQIG